MDLPNPKKLFSQAASIKERESEKELLRQQNLEHERQRAEERAKNDIERIIENEWIPEMIKGAANGKTSVTIKIGELVAYCPASGKDFESREWQRFRNANAYLYGIAKYGIQILEKKGYNAKLFTRASEGGEGMWGYTKTYSYAWTSFSVVIGWWDSRNNKPQNS